jgi:ATP-binding cassette subfamily B protein
MWRMLAFGYRHERALMLSAGGLSLLGSLPDALVALWLGMLGTAAVNRDRRLLVIAAMALALSAVGTWFLRAVSARVTTRFRDRMTIALESHIARLQGSIPTLTHQEQPTYLDRLAVLRNEAFVLEHMYASLFTLAGWVLRLGVTLALLASVNPALLLLAIVAVPPVVTSVVRPAAERAAEEAGAVHRRLARHLYVTASTPGPGKDVRITGIGARLIADRRAAWDRSYALISAARRTSAAWHAAAWGVFGAGFVGAVVAVVHLQHADPGQVLLVVSAGGRLSGYIGATVGEVGFLRGIWMDGARRLAWLEDYARSATSMADLPAPEVLVQGIRLQDVSFSYPGTASRALDRLSVDLPAGAVVALVGDNGAGKSTLVKLLCKLYSPDSGQILVDGVPLERIDTEQWRACLSGVFQDFFQFELRARESVGVGDLERLEDASAVGGAVARADATDMVDALPQGLETQLGPTWRDGTDLSFGQWQKVALARGFMRARPLLLVLDEPTAALDAEAEHAIFERYADAARTSGATTLLVSHRFGTVQMADLIIVLDEARMIEVGSHAELLARGGRYADLYSLQAAAYR